MPSAPSWKRSSGRTSAIRHWPAWYSRPGKSTWKKRLLSNRHSRQVSRSVRLLLPRHRSGHSQPVRKPCSLRPLSLLSLCRHRHPALPRLNHTVTTQRRSVTLGVCRRHPFLKLPFPSGLLPDPLLKLCRAMRSVCSRAQPAGSVMPRHRLVAHLTCLTGHAVSLQQQTEIPKKAAVRHRNSGCRSRSWKTAGWS